MQAKDSPDMVAETKTEGQRSKGHERQQLQIGCVRLLHGLVEQFAAYNNRAVEVIDLPADCVVVRLMTTKETKRVIPQKLVAIPDDFSERCPVCQGDFFPLKQPPCGYSGRGKEVEELRARVQLEKTVNESLRKQLREEKEAAHTELRRCQQLLEELPRLQSELQSSRQDKEDSQMALQEARDVSEARCQQLGADLERVSGELRQSQQVAESTRVELQDSHKALQEACDVSEARCQQLGADLERVSGELRRSQESHKALQEACDVSEARCRRQLGADLERVSGELRRSQDSERALQDARDVSEARCQQLGADLERVSGALRWSQEQAESTRVELQAAQTELQESRAAHAARIEFLNNDVAELSAKLRLSQDSRMAVQEAHDAIEAQCRKFGADFERARDEGDAARAELQARSLELGSEVERLRAELEKTQGENETLREDIEKLEEISRHVEVQSCRRLRAALVELRGGVPEAEKSEAEKSEAEESEDAGGELQQLRGEVDQLRGELQRCRQESAAVEQELQDARAQGASSAKLAGDDLARLGAELQKSEQEKEAAKKELQELQAGQKELRLAKDLLEARSLKLGGEVERLQTDLQKTQEALTNGGEWRDDFEQLLGSLHGAREENAALHEELRTARSAGGERPQLASEVQRLRADLRLAREARDAALAQLGRPPQGSPMQAAQFARLQVEKEAIRIERDDLGRELKHVQSDRLPSASYKRMGLEIVAAETPTPTTLPADSSSNTRDDWRDLAVDSTRTSSFPCSSCTKPDSARRNMSTGSPVGIYTASNAWGASPGSLTAGVARCRFGGPTTAPGRAALPVLRAPRPASARVDRGPRQHGDVSQLLQGYEVR